MRRVPIVLSAAAALAACGQSEKPANNIAANTAAAAPEKTPYCFFKDNETKGWKASADKDGNVVVKGKVYRQDSRYKAVLAEPKVTDTTAELFPSLTQNDSGYGAENDWWDVSLTIPGSQAVSTVHVRCGKKVIAELKVPRKA